MKMDKGIWEGGNRMDKWLLFLFMMVCIAIIISIVCMCNCDIKAPQDSETTQEDNVLTQEDKYELARILYLEAGSCRKETITYCYSVIMNQLNDGRYGKTIHEVLSRQGAFQTYNKPLPKDADLSVCYEVIEEGITILPSYVIFFSTSGMPYAGIETYIKQDNIYFQYFNEECRSLGVH